MSQDDNDDMIPLYEERLSVMKENVVSDHVRVVTSVEERAVLIQEDVERGSLQVERVQVEIPVQTAPAPRQDGDTLIVSVIEERLVVEKRLFVIEELRITRTSTIEHVAIPEIVRTMLATVERGEQASSTGRDTDG